MQITKKKLLSLVLALGLLFTVQAVSSSVQAATMWDQAQQGGLRTIGNEAFDSAGNPTDIRLIVARIIKTFLGLLGVVFVVLMVLAGFKYMTSQGDEGKISDSISQIKAAAIGLIIVLSAFGITVLVSNAVYKATTGLNP